MDFTTLSPSFLAADTVDEFISAVWTERYSKHGDTQLVLAASPKNVEMLREGTYLALRGSKEVMQIETQSIEDGKLTVVGNTLDEVILSERFVWAQNPEYTGAAGQEANTRIADYADATRKPGEFMSHVVDKFVINPTAFDAAHLAATLTWDKEQIDELSLGAIDTSGTVQRLTAPTGPVYAALEQLAEKHKVGMSLYLHAADPDTGWELKFKTYKGLDRTSGQSTNALVRLTPELDGISDLKEVRSIADFKNVVYVYYDGVVTKFLLNPAEPEPEGLDRRVLVTDAEGEPPGRKEGWRDPMFGGGKYTYVDPAELSAYLAQNAKDALANHNYIRSIDGKTSPISDYKFGTDYFLGDIIELQGVMGDVAQAQITEFIRSQDKTGEKSYPTISVVS